MRFSLMTMLVAFAFAAICCFGMLYANSFLATCFTTSAFLIMLFGILAAIVHTGRMRAFWIGFAVFGTPYYMFAFFGEHDIDPAHQRTVRRIGEGTLFVEPHLITTRLLLFANSYVDQVGPPRISPPAPFRLAWFVAIGHAIFTLLFALLGGALGYCFGQGQVVDDAQLG